MMNADQLRVMIDAFEAGAATPAAWAKGLSPQDLNAHPVPGTWSVQQVIVHVLDSDLAASHRFRRIVAEELPLLIAYDESLFSTSLSYNTADIDLVCRLFADHRRFTAQWLRTLPPAAFERCGVHNQRGKVSLASFVQVYVDHLTHHEKFVMEKRRVLRR